ncbi:MAG TPA: glycosyltransferase [Candidatus Saccharimonadales bacterium]|nr:glycosyltransferase [Candidatus Saccharimonadales bacterium]
MAKVPVMAVIPAYNAAKTLPKLLEQILLQGYDGIFVLDDASTDRTVKIAEKYSPRVKVIKGKTNVGAGANRNRIIGQVAPDVIIHFIDADVRLVSKNNPAIIRGLEWKADTAYYGGLLRNPAGEQNPFNFGPRPCLATSLSSSIQYGLWQLSYRAPKLAKVLRSSLNFYLKSWPNIFKQQKLRQVFWTAESNLIIKAGLFRELGGYDPQFRYGEINDLGLRLEKAGYKSWFLPQVDLLHTSTDNVYLHINDKRIARRQLVKKYGHTMSLWPWLYKKRLNIK